MTPQHDIIQRYRHRFPGPRYIETRGGWNQLIIQFLEELETLDPNRRVTLFCIKEKFGRMRIDLYGYPEDIFRELGELEHKFETLSTAICEDCGQPGKLRSGDWLKTACDAHA